MIIILSPAKKLQTPKKTPAQPLTTPMFFSEAMAVVRHLQSKKPAEIKKFLKETMDISEKLVEENCARFLAFQQDKNIGTPAVLTFAGDTFQGLKPDQWNAGEEKIASDHLFILSGLYGLLRPFDVIQPYRMEMGIAIAVDGKKNLYELWRERITTELQAEQTLIVNCASNEYAAVIDQKKLNAPFLTIDFKMKKGNRLQTPGMVVKNYRGQMASALIKKMAAGVVITRAVIKNTAVAGYEFSANDSRDNIFCFVK